MPSWGAPVRLSVFFEGLLIVEKKGRNRVTDQRVSRESAILYGSLRTPDSAFRKVLFKGVKMKKVIFLAFTALTLVLAGAPPVQADGGRGGHWRGGRGGHSHSEFVFRGGVWIGPGWGPWWGPPYYPYYHPYPYYPYYPAPPVVQEEPRVYVAPEDDEEDYWYFCTNPQGYYPYVKECPGGWMKVIPSTPSGPKR